MVSPGQLVHPLHEFRRGQKNRAVRRQLEGVLRLGRRLLARRVKLQRLVRDEIVERGPVAVRHRALFDQVIPGADGRGLEHFFRRERLLKMPVNFREEPRQIPGGEILSRRLRRRRALHEAPAVVLEILPIPMRQQRFEHRRHFLRRARDFRFQAGDSFLRFVALDVPFQRDFFGDGLCRFGVSLVLERAGDDRFQVGDGGFGQALLHRVIDLFPQIVPLPRVRRELRCHDQRKSQKFQRSFHNPVAWPAG